MRYSNLIAMLFGIVTGNAIVRAVQHGSTSLAVEVGAIGLLGLALYVAAVIDEGNRRA